MRSQPEYWQVTPWRKQTLRNPLHHLHQYMSGTWSMALYLYSDAQQRRTWFSLKTRDVKKAQRRRDNIYKALQGKKIASMEVDMLPRQWRN